MFRCPIHRIQIIVAIVKEVADFLPCAWPQRGVLTPQGLVQGCQPFMGLAIGAVQFQEGLIDAEGHIDNERTQKFLQRFVDAYSTWLIKTLAV